jgi:VIT1/CCC1 family predicted Fe2+/Mn2+ transporter
MSIRPEEHVVGGGKIRNIILGMNDGLISTFTLLVGIAVATIEATGSTLIVVLTGIAALVSGAVSMGLGDYISSKSEYNYIKNELKREAAEIELFPEEEKQEVKHIFEKMGFKGEQLNNCVETITVNKDVWISFLTKSELGLEEPENPTLGAIITFFSFILGSFITLFPYFFNIGMICLMISSIISFSMLFIVGILKTKITGEKPLISGLHMITVGAIAFLISYVVGLALGVGLT